MLSAVPAPASFMSPEYRSRLVNLEFQRAPVSLQLPLTVRGKPQETLSWIVLFAFRTCGKRQANLVNLEPQNVYLRKLP